MADALLSLVDVHKSFGGVKAVDGVSLDVDRSAVVGLIGPNGSGKSTLFDVISGVYKAEAGKVRFDGDEIAGLPPNRIYGRGLVRSFQVPRLFQRMTVLDNMLVSARDQIGDAIPNVYFRRREWKGQDRSLVEKARSILAFLDLSDFESALPTVLSGGQLKLLELARSLMSEPKMLLLDEPAAGVYPDLAKRIFERVHELRDKSGLSFLIIEHRMEYIEGFADYVYVMDRGKILSKGRPEAVMSDAAVVEAYFGN